MTVHLTIELEADLDVVVPDQDGLELVAIKTLNDVADAVIALNMTKSLRAKVTYKEVS